MMTSIGINLIRDRITIANPSLSFTQDWLYALLRLQFKLFVDLSGFKHSICVKCFRQATQLSLNL